MYLPPWLAILGLLLAPLAVGVAAGFVIDSASHLRSIRRTGHDRDCPAPRGWACTCCAAVPDARQTPGV